MIKNKSVLAFIPARGGSKSVPRKNIKNLAGKEMIGYTIEAARNTQICDRIVVSTDNDQIAKVSQKYGAEVPFQRPSELATDSASMMEVIKHGMKWIRENDQKYDIFLYLQPTSPFRRSKHIKEAFDTFFQNNAEAVVSVNKADFIPGRVNTLPEKGRMDKFVDASTMHANRQEMEQYYELNGAVDLIWWDLMEGKWNWYRKETYPYIIPPPYYLDIDTKMDYKFAQFLLEDNYVQL